jgi:hypothetical protein
MRPVSIAIVARFADAFCYGRSGYSLRELHDLFVQYQVDVPALDSGVSPTKGSYFHSCIAAMTPENQRQFLYDLCDDPPPATGPLPGEDARRGLLSILAAADGLSPLADGLSQVTLRAVRNQWFTAASRLPHSASSAITAARALLESTCQTILVEHGEAPDTSGDLGRLYNQTRKALQIEASAGVPQALHQLLSGLVQVVNGLAALSNQAGDRHGLPEGARISDHSMASLAVHAAGTVSLFLVRAHRSGRRASNPV